MSRCWKQLDLSHADLSKLVRHEMSAAEDIFLVLRIIADAGNAQELLKFLQKAILVLLYIRQDLLHDTPPRHTEFLRKCNLARTAKSSSSGKIPNANPSSAD